MSKAGPGPSGVSLSSNRSKDLGIDFKKGQTGPSAQLREMENSGPGPGSGRRPKDEPGLKPVYTKSKAGPGPSGVSLSSNRSKDLGIDFKKGQTGPSAQLRDTDCSKPLLRSQSLNYEKQRTTHGQVKQENQTGPREDTKNPGSQTKMDLVFQILEEQVQKFVQQQLQRLHRLLASDYPECSESEEEEPSREAVLTIALDFLKKINQEQLAQRLFNRWKETTCRDKLKRDLQKRFSHVFEGVAKPGESAPLTQIYTELYITEGGASEVNQEHEIRHMETMSRRSAAPEITIKCEDIFKPRPHSPEPIRAVLTKGVAGVGKTILTQKLSLDWAEGKAHQDLQLLFPFTFRELNVLRDTQFSLVGLLHHFFSPSKHLCSFQQLQVLFIFDGLDECRPPMDFSRTQDLTDPTESASVHVLLVNLIRGRLLPSARLWITTRPAAANQIPVEFVSMVTEVRGFTDPQKEEYFRKKFRDQAAAIISHIKSIRSLYIMSHIPIFCWILSTVLQMPLYQTEESALPRTLTQMYVHFLVVQAKVQNIKYHQRSGEDLHWTEKTKKIVWSLGKLAFEQLQKGNLIFYECDLSECGLDPAEASVYSGVFTQVFKEVPGLYQDKVYCFIHLSVQEFLAALHVHQTFFSSGENLLEPLHSESPEPEAAFYCSAVDQALQNRNGHLDLFLRFLLGLSLPTNQRLLQGLLTNTEKKQNKETVKYIKQKLNVEGLSAERKLNLLHCLNEMNDLSLVKMMQWYMREGLLSDRNMSPAEWSTLSFLLLSSDSDLEEFDLCKYQASERALLGLLSVVRASTKALLIGCGLSPHSCGPLASVLSSSSLTHLDLSHNDLQDAGVKLLCSGLKKAPCTLKTFSLSLCGLSPRSCGSLASVLSSSSLTHLDLSHNDLQDSGVELLCSGLKSAPCRLESLRLSGCLVSQRGGAALASALSSAPSHLRELDLSYNHPGPSAELLTALQDQRPLLSVRLDPAGERWMVPGLRKYSCEFSLDTNTAHRHLLLSEDDRTVTRVRKEQEYPDHEDRFTKWEQVLSCTGLRGRYYWEVQWTGEVSIAVSYRGIRRKGKGEECGFGNNDQSWSLVIYNDQYSVNHKHIWTKLTQAGKVGVVSGTVDVDSGKGGVPSGTLGVDFGRVGVFLDSEAGVLSFYEVGSDGKLFQLYTFNTTFTEPLFPGFGLLSYGSSVSLVKTHSRNKVV
ncbi:NACHT, LRR and PYD domains-containing protein 3-like [Periophthalmus magnuspinnatus]|uniref:NACHT, LRR and PYD domains-containing protein 3-like n=1 Tax=Periophthalmus magnuspinnatus TaxID=409849 RepID=UPI00145B8683|nr:NACHT, LRR and PYD domains-containing protein 3-like [Periophthalmus magnuspinnatus]